MTSAIKTEMTEEVPPKDVKRLFPSNQFKNLPKLSIPGISCSRRLRRDTHQPTTPSKGENLQKNASLLHAEAENSREETRNDKSKIIDFFMSVGYGEIKRDREPSRGEHNETTFLRNFSQMLPT